MFLLKKCQKQASLIFPTENIGVFGYKVLKQLTSVPLSGLVGLVMLWCVMYDEYLR